MTMNLKERSRYVVNRGKYLTTVDFDGDVSLAEKEAVVLSTAVGHIASTARALWSVTRGCYEWRRVIPEDVLRMEEQQIWWKMVEIWWKMVASAALDAVFGCMVGSSSSRVEMAAVA
ncbi:hypothetical protein BHE74_00039216 [Ensete ventricosum]|nr:hypothetical protein BHE74_00039216 [Ensete ventricosum]RZS13312.1 hypothetical protein BHM03_00044875 [Ensete ventricosum]